MQNFIGSEVNRRAFLRRATLAVAGVAALQGSLIGCTSRSRAGAVAPLDGLDITGNDPGTTDWKIVMVSNTEPGEPLIVSGTIYADDGKTPLEGVRLYVYHTDARGIYSDHPGNGQTPNARLKGWMLTDKQGRYEFRTIKPASYPGLMSPPAHVHSSASGAGYGERWIDNFMFADDSRLDRNTRARFTTQDSFSPIMQVTRGDDRVLRCVRDIRMKRA